MLLKGNGTPLRTAALHRAVVAVQMTLDEMLIIAIVLTALVALMMLFRGD